jgi:hypothetical protein
MAAIQDFANPRSMLTPGVAGGITMFVTNAVCYQFDLPHNWVGLGLNFLFGLIVFSSTASTGLERIALYVANSLIIFAMAFGTSSVGASLSEAQEPTPVTQSAPIASSAGRSATDRGSMEQAEKELTAALKERDSAQAAVDAVPKPAADLAAKIQKGVVVKGARAAPPPPSTAEAQAADRLSQAKQAVETANARIRALFEAAESRPPAPTAATPIPTSRTFFRRWL